MADAVGKSRSTVANLLRLLSLSPEVRLLLEHGDIEMDHARAILPLEQEKQIQAASQIVTKSFSVRETEGLVKNLQVSTTEEKHTPELPDLSAEAKIISRKINALVKIQHSSKGKGKMVIEYRNLELLINKLFSKK